MKFRRKNRGLHKSEDVSTRERAVKTLYYRQAQENIIIFRAFYAFRSLRIVL